MSDTHRLTVLREEYYAMKRELDALSREISTLEKTIRSQCEHEWEMDDSERGGRSYHVCCKCGTYR